MKFTIQDLEQKLGTRNPTVLYHKFDKTIWLDTKPELTPEECDYFLQLEDVGGVLRVKMADCFVEGFSAFAEYLDVLESERAEFDPTESFFETAKEIVNPVSDVETYYKQELENQRIIFMKWRDQDQEEIGKLKSDLRDLNSRTRIQAAATIFSGMLAGDGPASATAALSHADALLSLVNRTKE